MTVATAISKGFPLVGLVAGNDDPEIQVKSVVFLGEQFPTCIYVNTTGPSSPKTLALEWNFRRCATLPPSHVSTC